MLKISLSNWSKLTRNIWNHFPKKRKINRNTLTSGGQLKMLNALDLSSAPSVSSTFPTRFNALTNSFIDVQTTTRSLSKTISTMRNMNNTRNLSWRLKRKINKQKRVRNPPKRLILEISMLFRTLKRHQSFENFISVKRLFTKKRIKEISWMSSERDSDKPMLK